MTKARVLRLGLVLALTMGVAACSGATEAEPPTADIHASGSKLYVVIHLPAEEADYEDTHDLAPAGFSGIPSEVTIDSPASEVKYSQTGNAYQIGYRVVYRNGDVASYTVTVAGNVYGDVTHTLTK